MRTYVLSAISWKTSVIVLFFSLLDSFDFWLDTVLAVGIADGPSKSLLWVSLLWTLNLTRLLQLVLFNSFCMRFTVLGRVWRFPNVSPSWFDRPLYCMSTTGFPSTSMTVLDASFTLAWNQFERVIFTTFVDLLLIIPWDFGHELMTSPKSLYWTWYSLTDFPFLHLQGISSDLKSPSWGNIVLSKRKHLECLMLTGTTLHSISGEWLVTIQTASEKRITCSAWKCGSPCPSQSPHLWEEKKNRKNEEN